MRVFSWVKCLHASSIPISGIYEWQQRHAIFFLASRAVGVGGWWALAPQFLADQLTLPQPGGHIMPTTLLRALSDFQTLREPWSIIIANYIFVSLKIYKIWEIWFMFIISKEIFNNCWNWLISWNYLKRWNENKLSRKFKVIYFLFFCEASIILAPNEGQAG